MFLIYELPSFSYNFICWSKKTTKGKLNFFKFQVSFIWKLFLIATSDAARLQLKLQITFNKQFLVFLFFSNVKLNNAKSTRSEKLMINPLKSWDLSLGCRPPPLDIPIENVFYAFEKKRFWNTFIVLGRSSLLLCHHLRVEIKKNFKKFVFVKSFSHCKFRIICNICLIWYNHWQIAFICR